MSFASALSRHIPRSAGHAAQGYPAGTLGFMLRTLRLQESSHHVICHSGLANHAMTLPLPLRLPTSSSHRRPFFGTCPPSRQAHILHKRSRRLVAPATQAAAGSGSLHETGTYYEVLDVPRTADAQTIKSAYRRLVHKYHPVRKTGSAACGSSSLVAGRCLPAPLTAGFWWGALC